MLYFAYGPNIDPAFLREARDIPYGSRERGDLHGFRLAFNKPDPDRPDVAVANIVGDPRSIVQGALYEVDDAAIERLDQLEHVPDRSFFRTIMIVQRAQDGPLVEAEVHVGTDDDYSSDLLPRRSYLQHILNGRDILDAEYVEELSSVPVADE